MAGQRHEQIPRPGTGQRDQRTAPQRRDLAEEGDDAVLPYADEVIRVPATRTLFAALLTVIPLQIFASSVAEARGLNVDQPRNLAKSVTVE